MRACLMCLGRGGGHCSWGGVNVEVLLYSGLL